MQISNSQTERFQSSLGTGAVKFGNGKIRLYSDFDGTYFPGRQEELTDKRGYFQTYFQRFDDFLKSAGKSIDFTLTTGRDLASVQHVLGMMKKEGIPIHLPSSWVVQDGADEFLKATSKASKGFSWRGVNRARRDGLQNATGWDPNAVRSRLKDLFKRGNIPFQEEISDPAAIGLSPAERWGEAEPSVWIKQEGSFLLKLRFKSDSIPDREALRQKIQDAVGPDVSLFNFYARKGKADLGLKLKPRVGHLALSKHHDVGRAVESAERKNDLVVAAGDWCNDVTMLDPANYIPELRQYGGDPKRLREAIEQSPELQARLKKLPFIGIAVYGEAGLDECLKPLVEAYGGESPWRKLIPVAKGELVAGVQQAIREYRKQNPYYGAHLSAPLKVALGEQTQVGLREPAQPVKTSQTLTFIILFRALSRWFGKLLKHIGDFLMKYPILRSTRL